MCWQRRWFGGVDRFGNVVRRECCSDDLVRGHGCCMMLTSGVFDWATVARTIPAELFGEREGSAQSVLKSSSSPRPPLP